MAPTQLKIHTETSATLPPVEDVRGASKIAEMLTQATGWRFAFRRPKAERITHQDGWSPTEAGKFVLDSPTQEQATSLGAAEEIAGSINSLIEQLNETQHALWQREAELAAGVPVVSRPDDAAHLAARLQSAIRGGAEAIGCDAGAAYIMNDATTHLKLRSSWGLSPDCLAMPPRDLRGSIADLEALIGHAVVIEDANEALPWQPPEADFGAAVCVPISTPTTPLGTMWMFSSEPRPFSSNDTQIVELVAGRIAAELEREMLITQGSAATQIQRQLEHAGEWFANRLPQIAPLTSQWQFAGGRLDETPGGDFYDWSVRPDGRLCAAIGDCPGYNIESLLEAAAFKASYQSLLTVQNHPGRLLQMLNDSLWNASPGDAAASMFFCSFDEDTGAMDYATAGEPIAIAIRDTKFRSLVDGTPPLGADPDAAVTARRRRVASDETMIFLTESARHLPLRNGKTLNEAMIARAVRGMGQLDAEELVERLGEWILGQVDGPSASKTSVMAIRRRPPRV